MLNLKYMSKQENKSSLCGQNIEVQINCLNIQGEGVFYFEGKKGSVMGVLPEERVVVRVLSDKKDFLSCSLVKVISPSPLRIEPDCPYYYKCGGCNFLHIGKENSFLLKANVIKDFLSSIYSGDIALHKSTSQQNYRNNVAFAIDGKVVGLKGYHSSRVIPISYCKIAKENINTALAILQKYLQNGGENFSHAVVRSLDKSLSITLVCTKKPKDLNALVQNLISIFGENFGLYLNYNKNKKEILSDKFEHVFGQKFLTANEFGISFFVYPHAFLQVNDEIRLKLYERVSQFVAEERVVEGYSGVGILSAVLAQKAKSVTSIEINKSATKSANLLKERNNITNLENINGDFGEVFEKMDRKEPFTLVLDPPRKGLDKKVLDSITKTLPDKIVYVSCNPYTLKQNVTYLTQFYLVENVEFFDMFPSTFDIETLLILKRRKK